MSKESLQNTAYGASRMDAIAALRQRAESHEVKSKGLLKLADELEKAELSQEAESVLWNIAMGNTP